MSLKKNADSQFSTIPPLTLPSLFLLNNSQVMYCTVHVNTQDVRNSGRTATTLYLTRRQILKHAGKRCLACGYMVNSVPRKNLTSITTCYHTASHLKPGMDTL